MTSVQRLLLLMMWVVPAWGHAAESWWNDDWNFRKEISFDSSPNGANIAGTLQDVPVLVRLHAGNYGYFNDTKPDGSDLRFIDADNKTPLKFHIERFDAVNQLAFVWVRVPRIGGASNSQKMFLYYGNSKAVAAGDAAGTYDKNQALVLHFDGDQPTDATAYANKPSSSTAEMSSASLIAGGTKFNGSQSIVIPAGGALHIAATEGATLSTWVRVDAAQNDAYLMALEDKAGEFVLGIRGNRPFARIATAAGKAEVVAGADISATQWHHVAVAVAAGKLILYVDGAVAGNVPAQIAETGGTLTVGSGPANSHGLVGELDEVQFSNIARSTDWIDAAARSQGVEAPLVAYGGDSQREAQKVSYFKVTLQNVTADGWVVIVILAVMFLIALVVMTTKSIYLARVRGGNTAFLREFEKLRDPAALAEGGGKDFMPTLQGDSRRFGASNIYQLYQRGINEVGTRVAANSLSAAAARALTPQAVNAMRAALDASQVRLTQKMTSNMVLLTIAIAGGPFLGLLGTVVGVMITFAAIAASGDVNVNSIAPGIAAALVATVAGLAVAIPALFGYNWLNTRIKDINADMRVFVDEFITKIAEYYAS